METTTLISFKQGDNLIATLGEKRGITCFQGWCWEVPPHPRLASRGAGTARAASSAFGALLQEICRAEAWDSAAWGTVAESRVITGAARPLDAPARFQRHRILWKLRGYLALRVNEELGLKARAGAGEGRTEKAFPSLAALDHPPAQPPRGTAALRPYSPPEPSHDLPPKLGADFPAAWALAASEAPSTGNRVNRRDPPGRMRCGFPAQCCSAPRLRAFTCSKASDSQTDASRRDRRRPCRARAPTELSAEDLGGGDGGAPAELSRAGRPPSRGDRGLSSLLGLLKSSFPGESGDVRGPASRWRGRRAGEAASSYPITDCQSCCPSPILGGGGDPSPPPARDSPGTPLGLFPGGQGP